VISYCHSGPVPTTTPRGLAADGPLLFPLDAARRDRSRLLLLIVVFVTVDCWTIIPSFRESSICFPTHLHSFSTSRSSNPGLHPSMSPPYLGATRGNNNPQARVPVDNSPISVDKSEVLWITRRPPDDPPSCSGFASLTSSHCPWSIHRPLWMFRQSRTTICTPIPSHLPHICQSSTSKDELSPVSNVLLLRLNLSTNE
jgi:hypothetical protein